ncbi:integral membrane protein [Seiridium cupressi]
MSDLWRDEEYGLIADKVCWGIFCLTSDLGVVIVLLRLYCRARTGRKFLGALGLDDLVTLVCLMIILSACILTTIASGWGLGKHFASLDEEHQVQAMKYNAVIDAVIIWSFSTPKFAIVFLLKRILNHGRKTTVLFWTLVLIGQVAILATSIWVFKQCDPIDYQWEQYRHDDAVTGTCAPVSILTGIGYFGSSYSAFLDVFFALYPVPFVMRLRMPLKSRISISLCLSLGAVACVISVYKLSIIGTAFALMGDDPTFPIPYLNTLGLSEACVLIVCGSLPALGPLFRSVKRKVSRTGSNGSRSYQTYVTNDSHLRSQNGWTRIDEQKRHDPDAVLVGPALNDDGIQLTPVDPARSRHASY